MWVWTGARSSSRLIITSSYDCSVIATRSGKTEAGRQDCIHIFSTRKDVFPKFTMQVFCSFLSIPMCGKSRKHSFNTEVIVDSSISRAWTPLIYLVKSNQSEVIPGAGIPERAVWRNDYRLRRPSSPQFPLVFFMFALSQFSGPEYLGLCIRLGREDLNHVKSPLSVSSKYVYLD